MPATCQQTVREVARKKISELLIDKEEGGGEIRLLWEKNVTNHDQICLFNCSNFWTGKSSTNI